MSYVTLFSTVYISWNITTFRKIVWKSSSTYICKDTQIMISICILFFSVQVQVSRCGESLMPPNLKADYIIKHIEVLEILGSESLSSFHIWKAIEFLHRVLHLITKTLWLNWDQGCFHFLTFFILLNFKTQYCFPSYQYNVNE